MMQVYTFEEGSKEMRELLGNKGAQLSEMYHIGIPVPPGFIITTKACIAYLKKKKIPDSLKEEILSALEDLEKKTGKKFGDASNPLLVSVRSGAPVSMPGMMDTILNIGLNDEMVETIAKNKSKQRWVYDCYRRFIQMFSEVVLGISHGEFEREIEEVKKKAGVEKDHQLGAKELKELIKHYKVVVKRHNAVIPSKPEEQLQKAIVSVFSSWNTPRARKYRELNKIPDDLGTAAVVQAMVYGNKGKKSGTGVLFTRNPSNGKREIYGEYLMNAQGEDIVSGTRTPNPIKNLKKEMPQLYSQLQKICRKVEEHFKDMQDMEFTIEEGKLYILQTRTGKRTSMAAIKIAVDMVKEKLITKKEALLRVQTSDIEKILHPVIDPKAKYTVIAKGLNASPGAASGKVIFDTEKAAQLGKEGQKVLLVREETTPDDIHGIAFSQGILTTRGGMTSHAAVVARGMGKPCVCGCGEITIDSRRNRCRIGNIVIKEGDILTIDGSTGEVIKGEVPLVPPSFTPETKKILTWADEVKRLEVRANADTPEGAKLARKMGARGIGLCRTERMFNEANRLPIVRAMILAKNRKERMKALEKLLPLQKRDFKEILRIMHPLPVTIRLLDIPLHEFLPSPEELLKEIEYLKDFKEVMKSLQEFPHILQLLDPKLQVYLPPIEKFLDDINKKKYQHLSEKLLQEKISMLEKVRSLEEVNPMLGHRGVRLGITYPEIYDMQIRAIYEASAELIKEGMEIHPEIMVPQVCTAQELKWVFKRVKKIASEVEKKYEIKVPIKFGTMIEVVRACMRAGKLAEIAEFFSFGTNDLSQATFSFSREDAEKKFLPLYTKRKILQDNPFSILDQKGVGRLMMIAIEWGRKTRKDLKIGVCGEQGGEPSSIHFCHRIGIDYVSCSPFRVPVARLAAAQAALKE